MGLLNRALPFDWLCDIIVKELVLRSEVTDDRKTTDFN
jgi:hypothetical protein